MISFAEFVIAQDISNKAGERDSLSAFESLQGLSDDEATEASRHVSDVGSLEDLRIDSETNEAEQEKKQIWRK